MTNAYLEFSRAEWARLRAQTPLTLTEADLVELQGINERVSLADVESIYLPLSRLLNLHVAATQTLRKAADTFLGTPPGCTPYVIGVAGSVAVGKSTLARILQALLALGYAVEWHEYLMGHSVSPLEIAELNDWLVRVLSAS